MSVRTRDVWVLFAVSLSLRLAYALLHTRSIYFNHPILDSLWIHQWATALAAGEGSPPEAFFRAPLYPYLVGGVYRLFGPHPWIMGVVQHVIGAVSVVLLYRVGTAVAGRTVGWIAGWLLSFYWIAVFFEGELLIVTLATALGLAFADRLLAAGRSGSWIAYGVAGLVLGLAAIARPNFLVWVPIAIGAPFVWRRGRPLAAAAAALIGVSLAVAPVTIRNAVVGGDPVLIASQGGLNFHVGNGAGADGKTARAPGAIGPTRRDIAAARFRDNVTLAGSQIAERDEGRQLRPSEVSVYWFQKTWKYVQQNPMRATGLLFRKCAYLLNGFEVGDNKDLREAQREKPWIYALFVRLVWVMPFAVVGLVWVVFRRFKKCYIIVLLMISYGASIVLFFVNARMRLPMVPWVFLLAAVGLAVGWERVTRRSLPDELRWRGGGRDARVWLGALAAGVLVSVPKVWGVGEEAGRAGFRMNRGTLLIESGDCAGALSAFREAASIDPGMLEAHFGEARALERCGRLGESLEQFGEIGRRWPEFPHALLGQARVAAAMGDTAEAEAAYRRAMVVSPTLADVPLNFAAYLLSRGRHGEAATLYVEGLRLDPSRLSSWMNYGYTLAALDRLDEATAAWESALRIDPGNAMATNNIEKARALLEAR
jgi:Tfp pilus assembly protein PilF